MTNTLTHAYTVRQPFAYATAVGWKPIENKTERPPLALIGKLVGIHAGLQWARESDLPSWAKSYEMPAPTDSRLVYGALIGVARLVGVVRRISYGRPAHHGPGERFELMHGNAISDEMPPVAQERIRPWWRGPWGWLWSNEPGDEPLLLPEPIPMRGQQGLWRLRCDACGREPRDHDEVVCSGSLPWRSALEQWRKARGA